MQQNLKIFRVFAMNALLPVIILMGAAGAPVVKSEIRAQFYKAFSSGQLASIDNTLEVVKATDGEMAKAYQGALMMKKADLIKGAGDKLKMFKAGHEVFEKEIAARPQNTELRFIRLCIQENAPKILKYRKDLEEDKAFIVKNFGTLSSEVKKYILDYAASSGILTTDELTN